MQINLSENFLDLFDEMMPFYAVRVGNMVNVFVPGELMSSSGPYIKVDLGVVLEAMILHGMTIEEALPDPSEVLTSR